MYRRKVKVKKKRIRKEMSQRNIFSDEVVILDNKVIAPLGAFRISPLSISILIPPARIEF
jgi:hypothetical protein